MSSALNGITSSIAASQSNLSSSISIPTDLTPAQDAEVQSILGQLASGSITAAQAQSEISAISSSASGDSGGTQGTQGTHHGHHGKHADGANGSSQAQTLASALDLTADQQTQITSIVQSAQQTQASPATVLSQIEGILSPEQQQKLAQLLSPTYSSVGTNGTGSQPPLFSTTA